MHESTRSAAGPSATAEVTNLQLNFIEKHRTLVFRRRTHGSTLDERVMASLIAYRTFVAEGKIWTDVLVEDKAGVQYFMPLQDVTFLKSGPDIQSVESVTPKAPTFRTGVVANGL